LLNVFTMRMRDRMPKPHVAEHSDQAPQGCTSQCTGAGVGGGVATVGGDVGAGVALVTRMNTAGLCDSAHAFSFWLKCIDVASVGMRKKA
jgi:hypothetical protein